MNSPPDEPAVPYAVCACQHCGGNIEFDASDFAEDEHRLVECPHCNAETEIFVSPRPAPPPVPPTIPLQLPVPGPTWFGTEASAIEIRTVSGTPIEIKEVQLYNEQELKKIAVEKARVAELLGGSQSPFGFIGGAFWVISNMIAQNYVAQKQSGEMAKEGFALIENLARREQRLRKTQYFFPVGRIENADYPSPDLWRVVIPGRRFGFVHSGDAFVTVRNAGGVVHSIRWSAVEGYTYRLNQ